MHIVYSFRGAREIEDDVKDAGTLEPLRQITTRNRIVGRGRDCREAARRVQHVLNGHLGNLRDRQLALRAVRPGHDVADRRANVALIRAVVVGAFRLGFHRSQSRRVVQRQVTDRR